MRATPARWRATRVRVIQRVAGAVLVVMGIAMATGLMDRLGVWLRAVPIIGSIG
jgi:hypothetical protein